MVLQQSGKGSPVGVSPCRSLGVEVDVDEDRMERGKWVTCVCMNSRGEV